MHDTDSFLLQVLGDEDVYSILQANFNLFDFSNLPPSHVLMDDTNKMKPGFAKFELGAATCVEFCAVSPKCYIGFKQTLKGSRTRLLMKCIKIAF